MTKYASWPTVDSGNVVGTRLSNEIYHRFGGVMNTLSFNDQKDAALVEILATTGETFNVRSFGAVGDGVTDDSAAIQAAITAADAVNGVVHFPPGTYAPVDTIYTVPNNVGISSAGAGGIAFTFPVGGQGNFINNWHHHEPKGTYQQIGFASFIETTNLIGPGVVGRIAGFFGGQTRGGTGPGTGEALWGINVLLEQNAADTSAQLVGIELGINNNKVHAALNDSITQIAYSANNASSFATGIAFVASGTGQWVEGYRIDAGSIKAEGYAFRYRGNAIDALSPLGITSLGCLQLGLSEAPTLGVAGHILMAQTVSLDGLDTDGSSIRPLIKLDGNDRVSIDPGGSGVAYGLPVVALGGGAAPTLGTIGGSGPAVAGQNSWKKEWDSAGNAYFIPIWR